MNANILLNLLNELWKNIRCEGLPHILSVFRNEFYKLSNIQKHECKIRFYHMSLESHFISDISTKTSGVCLSRVHPCGHQRITLRSNLHI